MRVITAPPSPPFASSHLRIFPSSIFILCLLLVISGCAPAKGVPTGPFLPPPPDIIEKISRADLRDKILTGTAHMTVESPDGFFSANCVIAVQYPSSLRLETLPPLGPPDLYLALRGDSLKVFLPRKEEFYVSRDAKTSLPRFIPFRLNPREVIPLLAGILPPGTLENRTALKGGKEDLLYRIDTFSDKKTRLRSIWLEPSRMELARFESYGTDGSVLYTVTFKDYRMVREMAVPDRIEIRSGGDEEKDASFIRIRYSDLQLSSGEENKDLFDLEIPSGIKPVLLD
jgi:outer membrane lipoprotein-sorting protein